jgi:hypothetical protein
MIFRFVVVTGVTRSARAELYLLHAIFILALLAYIFSLSSLAVRSGGLCFLLSRCGGTGKQGGSMG